MSKFIYYLIDFSEVWALIIPLIFVFPLRKLLEWQRPVAVYIIVAFIFNLISVMISNSNLIPFKIPLKNNVFIYNFHSIIRFACFCYFFILIKPHRYVLEMVKKLIPLLYIIIFLANFFLIDSFFNPRSISGNLLTIESYLLLVYCLLYFLSVLKEEESITVPSPEIWIVGGVAIYVVTNFFLFLYYDALLTESRWLADNMWSIHNVAYSLLCLFIAQAFYQARKEGVQGKLPRPGTGINKSD